VIRVIRVGLGLARFVRLRFVDGFGFDDIGAAEG
jgi:hypothetical protein